MNVDAMVLEIRNAADARLASGHKHFADDQYMLDVYAKDHKDMVRVADYMAKGDFSGAADLAWYLDTIVREEIPDSAWKFLRNFF